MSCRSDCDCTPCFQRRATSLLVHIAEDSRATLEVVVALADREPSGGLSDAALKALRQQLEESGQRLKAAVAAATPAPPVAPTQ